MHTVTVTKSISSSQVEGKKGKTSTKRKRFFCHSLRVAVVAVWLSVRNNRVLGAEKMIRKYSGMGCFSFAKFVFVLNPAR